MGVETCISVTHGLKWTVLLAPSAQTLSSPPKWRETLAFRSPFARCGRFSELLVSPFLFLMEIVKRTAAEAISRGIGFGCGLDQASPTQLQFMNCCLIVDLLWLIPQSFRDIRHRELGTGTQNCQYIPKKKITQFIIFLQLKLIL